MLEQTAHKHHIYRHYKGTLYHVLDIGLHTETGMSMVIYRELGDFIKKPTWVRPFEMFEEYVGSQPRFKVLGTMETYKQVRKSITSLLNVAFVLTTWDARLEEDLGADSLGMMELATSCRIITGKEIPDDVLESLKTVGDVVMYLDNLEVIE